MCDAERQDRHSHAGACATIVKPQPLPQKCFSTTMARTTQSATSVTGRRNTTKSGRKRSERLMRWSARSEKPGVSTL
ncbi:hypothetical protein CCL23_00005, partial [Pseudomonas syringae]